MADTSSTRPRGSRQAATPARGAAEAGSARDSQRTAIISSALELLDESGLDAFSMRKLAARLGMSVGNLYLYFDDRDELLDAVRDAVSEAITAEPISDCGDWQTALKQVMHHYRDELHAHPGAMVLLQRTRSISPGMWRLGSILTDILQHAGIADPTDIVLYNRVLVWTLSGFIAQEDWLTQRTITREAGPDGRPRSTLVLSPGTIELIMAQPESLRHLGEIDVDRLFEATIDAVIKGIAAVAAKGPDH
jgi:TetR/AcrR family tetracycline transcriptional repressor